jgi:hypothetical protein
MADKVSRFAPTGSMDKDSDPRYVGKGDSNGDYIDARNIQCVPQDENENGSISPTLGNEFAFSLGSVSQQNKRYRIVLDGDPLKQHELRFLSTQRDADMVTPNGGPNGGLMFNGTVTSFTTAFNNAISGSGVSWVLSTSTPGAVEIELASYPMYQWYLESVGTDVIVPVVIAEAIPSDLAGPLKDIGSYDLLGDLFIFSTTQDNEPAELPLTITTVGPTILFGTVAVGPLTYITFSGAHGLSIGNWIRITNSLSSWLNGVFVVTQVVSPTQIAVPTVLAWGGTQVLSPIRQEIVAKHIYGIGEIGVAQKDENTDSWTYIRLLRSVELNFVSKWQIDCDGEKDVKRLSLYFDDDYNTFRKFYYIGPYEQDGALNFENNENLYLYNSIQAQMYGFEAVPRVFIDFVSQSESGGQLPAGNIRYFVVLKDLFGNESLPSDLSNNVITYTDDVDGEAIGNNEGDITPKVNTMRISGINASIFGEIALGYLILADGAYSATLNEFIDVTGDSIEISHTGNEPSTVFDVGLLASNRKNDFKYAKNIRVIDGRLVRSNLRKDDYTSLSEWAQTFKHRICVKRISETLPFSGQTSGEYKDPDNGFYSMGYMYNETYRMSMRAHMTDGSLTDWFWVDDIRIDPFLTNQANPDDNRRDQTGPDISVSFDLTEDVPSSISQYSRKAVLIPYIDFFGFDLSATINNRLAYEIIEKIEIGRSEVIPEVLFSGLGVLSVKIKTAPHVTPPVLGDSLVIDGIQRGFPMVGSWIAATPIYPQIALGLGVREADRDGFSTETFHEYPWASLGPFGRMSGTSSSPAGYLDDNLIISTQTSNENLAINGLPAIINQPPLFEYPSATGTGFYRSAFIEIVEGVGPVINGPNRTALVSERRFLSIYSPDNLMSDAGSSGFTLIDFGEVKLGPGLYPIFPTPPNPGTFQFFQKWWQGGGLGSNAFKIHLPSAVTRLHSEGFGNTYRKYDIDSIKDVEDGERKNFDGFTGFRKAYDAYSYGEDGVAGGVYQRIGWPGMWKMKGGPVCYVENSGLGIENQSKNPDYGMRYVQVFSEKKNKYGSKGNSTYYTTGAFLNVPSLFSYGIAAQGTLPVFGGDVFTQQSSIKTRYQDVSVAPAGTDPETWDTAWGNIVVLSSGMPFEPDLGPGWGCGLIFYSQNRVNSQMRYATPEQYVLYKDTNFVPTDPLDTFAFWAQEFNRLDTDTYSSIYTPSNKNLGQISGDYISRIYTYDYPQRIQWSERKIYGELIDQFAIFLLANIKDLDLRFGEIHHHESVNGELFTLQKRKWQRQLFNTRGELQVTGSSIGALIGDGSVLSRDGQTLSSYGSQNKWSCQLGKSQGGGDVLCWYNAEHGLFMRFGADGTIVLSDTRKMRNFSRIADKWVSGKDTPAFEQGIRTVWDDRSKEMIWTFTGWRDLPEWTAIFTEVGKVVKNSNAPSDSYEDFPRFFKCKLVHIGSSLTEPGVGADWETYWEQIPYDDTNYYSIFTLAHNEATNGFSTFYDHIPKTYLKWRDTFLSSHPTERNLIFEHRKGEPTTWYGVDSFLTGTIPPKIEDAYIEAVINDLPEESKRFISTEVLSENVPDRIEYRTKSQYTWSEPADFKVNDDQFRGFILNDATVSQDPRGNTRRMDGDYMKAKFIFIGGTMNKLYSMVVKLRGRLRDFRQ